MESINGAHLIQRIRERCEQDFKFFVRYFFKSVKGSKFVLSDHHDIICNALEDVFYGRTSYLIINMPPRYSKTEIAVKMFTAWCYVKNPKCDFIHLSYADILALDNSETVKQIIKSTEFKQLWPDLVIKPNKDSKKAWGTEQGGVFYATSAGGPITGFGAGKMNDFVDGNGFGGCFPSWQKVNTEIGSISFKELIDGKASMVSSFDEITGDMVMTPILRRWINPPSHILRVEMSDGSNFDCTPDHEVLTESGWVCAIHLANALNLMDCKSSNARSISAAKSSVIGSVDDAFRVLWLAIPFSVRESIRDRFPCLSSFDLPNDSRNNPILSGENRSVFYAFEYLNYLYSSKLCSGPTLKDWECSVPQGVLHVVGLSAIREIGKRIIKEITVQVSDLIPLGAFTYKLLSDEVRDVTYSDTTTNREAYPEVSMAVGARLKRSNGGCPPDLSKVRNLIKPVGVSDSFPVSVRYIGHVEQTFCLTVGGGNNFILSQSGAVVSNCIIIDDPLKPDDAYSDPKRESVNRRWDETIKSRFNSRKTPCIVIMQRIHELDFCGMLLKDSEYKFTHLVLPAIVDEGKETERPLWPAKHDLPALYAMRAKNSYMFASQMQQMPAPLGGGIIKGAWFKRYSVLPPIKYKAVFVDTAQKAGEHNDYQVAELWALGEDGNLYMVDILRDKFMAYELETRIPDFWNKHKADKNGRLRYMAVEDKSSGTELIQKIQHKLKPRIPIRPIPRGPKSNKLTRVMDVQGYIESGYIYLPDNAPWVSEFIAECESFTADDTHAHDDQIDPMCDAISQMLHNTRPNVADIL